MPWWQNGFLLGFVVFPALAFVAGLVSGGVSGHRWVGALAGALTTVALSVTVANDSWLPWMPVHALCGFLGGTLGCEVRRAFRRSA